MVSNKYNLLAAYYNNNITIQSKALVQSCQNVKNVCL